MSGIDNHTILMLHMNDDTFKDECGHEVINNGATLDTTNKKFGNGSAYFNGSNPSIVVNKYNDLDMTTKDFTIDFLFFLKSRTQYSILFNLGGSLSTTNGHSIIGASIGFYGFVVSIYTTSIYDINCGNLPDINKWYHYALCKKDNNFYVFLNGILYKIFEISDSLRSYDLGLIIGQFGNNSLDNNFIGNIDEFRISNVARWTKDFIPPISEYNRNRFLIKQNNQYYSIKPEFYNEENDEYNPTLVSSLNINNFDDYGLDNLSDIHSNALLKLIEDKYNIAMLV